MLQNFSFLIRNLFEKLIFLLFDKCIQKENVDNLLRLRPIWYQQTTCNPKRVNSPRHLARTPTLVLDYV